jgi:hypothetical protein
VGRGASWLVDSAAEGDISANLPDIFFPLKQVEFLLLEVFFLFKVISHQKQN